MPSISSSLPALLLAFLSLGSGVIAHADVNKVGNGGNAVVCENEKEKVRFLDLYEAKDTKDIVLIVAKETPAQYEKYVESALERIQQASPKLGSAYRNRWKEFPDQVEWVSEKKLVKVDDSLHTEEPLDDTCKIVQLAIRRDKVVEGEKRFQIRKDLWDQLSSVGKAALVMHELLYQHFSRLGEKDSRAVRTINRLLFAKEYESKKFWKLIKDLRVPIYPD
jgi:hypothetical protein